MFEFVQAQLVLCEKYFMLLLKLRPLLQTTQPQNSRITESLCLLTSAATVLALSTPAEFYTTTNPVHEMRAKLVKDISVVSLWKYVDCF